MRFDVDEDLSLKIEACKVLLKKDNNAETCRTLLAEATERILINSGQDVLNSNLRRIVKEELKITENRLAKILSKASVAAASAMYMTYQALHSLGIENMKSVYEQARKKAVAFVKTPLEELIHEEDSQ